MVLLLTEMVGRSVVTSHLCYLDFSFPSTVLFSCGECWSCVRSPWQWCVLMVLFSLATASGLRGTHWQPPLSQQIALQCFPWRVIIRQQCSPFWLHTTNNRQYYSKLPSNVFLGKWELGCNVLLFDNTPLITVNITASCPSVFLLASDN